jgi:hypothetical protein
LRGAEREIITAARKKATYKVVWENMKRRAGRLGLKLGAIPECPGVGTLGIGTIGG